jgi:transposase InsO family protein
VERLMTEHGIQGAKRRGKPWRTTRQDPAGQNAPDLVERDFTAPAPNRLWVADFTYLRTWQGVVYFAFVLDVFSRMVVGWQFATHMRQELVLDALRMALGLRDPGADVALVAHSDRGSQYTSDDYAQTLDDHDVARSLGSTGDCYDNALAESFVDSFKTELICDRVWRTHEQAELAIVEWVGWYNHQRLHSSLGDIPPVEYERHWALTQPATAAHPERDGRAGSTRQRRRSALEHEKAQRHNTPQTAPAAVWAPLATRGDRRHLAGGRRVKSRVGRRRQQRPPMEMTSLWTTRQRHRDPVPPEGCPQGLGQPAHVIELQPDRGLPTFPQALLLSALTTTFPSGSHKTRPPPNPGWSRADRGWRPGRAEQPLVGLLREHDRGQQALLGG